MGRAGRLLRSLCVVFGAGVAFLPSSALAHHWQVLEPDSAEAPNAASAPAAAEPEMFPLDPAVRARAAANPGPCTGAAADSMPDGDPHDHQQIGQHKFGCGLELSEFLPLKDEATRFFGREDVIFGEMDVKADIAAVAVTFPRAGIVFFDVADAAKPKVLSHYRGGECDSQPIDINCGAFVDLSFDGKVAYLAVQNLSSLPDPNPTMGRPGTPGVEVISLADPRAPRLVQTYTVSAGFTGTHTARSHVIPPEGPGPRAPGEYVFSVQNAVGVNIARVTRVAGQVPQLTFVSKIDTIDLHDTFIQNDPTDGRTYLYLADGFGTNSPGRSGGGTAFVVYDVTDPAQPKYVAQWDLTPECETDWYSHTIDVATRNGRRYVTLPTELFLFGAQASEDQSAGCGENQGNGDKVGPMWIVDATDFKALPQAADSDDAIKAKSQAALVTTWENPAGRAGGQLTFSPHNQQIEGDKIYLSHYHAGAYVLDASKTFDGVRESAIAERPRELAFVVPSGEPTRKNVTLLTRPVSPFFTGFPFGHPEIWDMFFYKGYFLVADETGGFYSYREVPVPGGGGGGPGPGAQPPGQGGSGGLLGRKRFLISRRAVRMSRRGVVGVRVSGRSTVPCRGTMRLRTAKRFRSGRRTTRIVLARKSFNVRAKRRATLKLRLSARSRRLVIRSRRTRVLAIANVAAAGAERKFTVTAGFRVGRPGR